MTEIFNFGEYNIVGSDPVDQITRPVGVTKENRQMVDTKPSTDNAEVSAYGLPKISFESIQRSLRYSQANLQINFIETITGSGSSVNISPGILSTSSGAAINSGIRYVSKFKIVQSISKGLLFRQPIIFPNPGIAGNIREVGLYDPATQNGWLLRLNGTIFQFVVINNGVETITDDSTSWNIDPFTLDTNLHLYEVQTKGVSTGDFDIFIDKKLRHSLKNLGVSSSSFASKIDNQIFIRNENTTNNTNVIMNVAPTTVLNEGEEQVIVSDGVRNVLLNSSRRLLVQGAGSPLMGEKFDKPLDTVNRWLPTVVGAATWTQPSDTYTLFLSNTTAATDSVELIFRENNLEETTGGFAEFEIGAKFGDTLEAGNVREWGYIDSAGLNGVFFRLDGGDLSFINLKGGVELVTSLADSLPNLNFHLYRIEHLGAGKISGFIDGSQVVDFSPAAASQVGSAEKKPFIKMYNTGVLAGTPSDCEFHWVRLLDQSGTRTTLVGVDDNNIFRTVAVSSNRRLLVETQDPAPPPDTFPIPLSSRSARSDVSTTVGLDTIYTITNGRQLTIQSFNSGAANSNSGSIVELFEDPNGDLSVLNLIRVAYLNDSNFTSNFAEKFDGDGTRRIVLRRKMGGGGTAEIFGAWQGFEQVI